MARAGKVAITPKGTFENGTVYEKLDTVEYNGTLYIAKKASSGVLPTDTEYWMLAVDLTGKMDTTGDSKNNIVTFTSADATDPTGWQDVQVLTSKEKHLSLFNKISTMMSNMRYLYKILGTTDISALGSVTQAIANLNSNVGGIKGISSSAAITTQGQYALDAREKNASVDGTLANKIDVLNSNLKIKVGIASAIELIECASDVINVHIFSNLPTHKLSFPVLLGSSVSSKGVVYGRDMTTNGKIWIISPISQTIQIMLIMFI